MTDKDVDPAEVQDNLSRAEESLAAARELFESGHPDFAASRAYYAAFYAARAAVVSIGLIRSKHSGIRAAVDEHFVKVGKLPVQASRAFHELFDLRIIGDYGRSSKHVSPDEAKGSLELARYFVTEIKVMLQKEMEK